MGFEVNGKFPESYIDFIAECITLCHGSNWTGKRILEIGDNDPNYDLQYFVDKGMEHTLIEPVRTDGNPWMPRIAQNYIPKVLPDASQLAEYMNYFDVITNIGCIEHLEPLDSHYEIWKNLHDMCKVGGVMIHIMPDIDECDKYLRWYGHCHYFFNTAFFEFLEQELGYEIIANDLLNWNRSVAVKKITNSQFNIDRETFLNKFNIR